MLKVTDLRAGYGSLDVLKGVTFEVPHGQVVALLGGNGAGKTTTLNAIMGLIRRRGGAIEFQGRHIETQPAHRIFEDGLSLVPQGRELFPEMTVSENLELGAMQRNLGHDYSGRLQSILKIFPGLRPQLQRRAGMLSGGQQQMLATARALMSDPQLLLLDEPSTGLAPVIVSELRKIIEKLRSEGRTVLLVEQNTQLALGVADYVYVIRNGTIVSHGETAAFTDRRALFQFYIG
jgi:branched-chain amino acid transport system ATP-binding protein